MFLKSPIYERDIHDFIKLSEGFLRHDGGQ